MKQQNHNCDRLQVRLSSLFNRLIDPFRSADSQAVDHGTEKTNRDIEAVSHTPPVSTQPARLCSPIIRIERLVVALDASQQS
ncbi:MAG: hypothetical protein MUQ10_14535, partial [Anaerolineae bacterium]|nr:hypothetical protein [Anaerolineae bacterium]